MSEPRISGLAPWRADLPDVIGCHGGWVLMGAAADETPEARLRRQVGWCRAAVDVLPLSPRLAPTRAEAERLVATRGPDLERAHRHIRGRLQVIVQLEMCRTDLGLVRREISGGRSWLQDRAERATREARANADFEAQVRRVVRALFPREGQVVTLAPSGTAGQLRLRRAVLVPRAGLQAFAAALSADLDRDGRGGLWDVIAPLPPLAFAALEAGPGGAVT
ncbi:GvpL/GvpF family gas vesicle protein [Rhodobacter capsulatus]|uniref:Gas vesicle synthesis protein GvpL/GvpF n=1 Tax=Rhodobacter capsulatus (strain ATCC BAA-309 / NBRC 16581 / SB1003) TaxID=272942 RepID=D5AR15_RHOCB|nr:hypothetical protein [Rhodobacter capsulatus]ADE84821.1 conserved hypothetical protein [Rhodobacter capsulatus SB 1003]ETD02451.1 hypothetical protein U714_06520 [Rhodobacter capsulatus DE442]ETD78417.1 hypothetical protein U717_06525 [Rhodobacter capsulatus R121]ETE54531.1 hypothetical protein U715_06515 [Rhodobacter capsulatus Y262]MDS0925775.1 hypothetical protein [Rhodobacter capsulatus]